MDLEKSQMAKEASKVLEVIKMDLGRFQMATEALEVEVIRMAMIWSGTVKQVSGGAGRDQDGLGEVQDSQEGILGTRRNQYVLEEGLDASMAI